MDDIDIVGLQFFICLIVLCVVILAVTAYADHRRTKRNRRVKPAVTFRIRNPRKERLL